MLAKQQIHYTRFLTTPAPLQNWLWYIVAGNDSGYYVGYRSVFEHSNELALKFFPCNDSLLQPLKHTKEVEQLIRFSKHFYTIEKNQDTLIFNDLRFGQIIGWQNPEEKFAFYYFLHPDLDNTLVVQRGRFAKWDEKSIKSMVRRIRGDQFRLQR
jgi:inner membrane protein